MQGKHIGNIVTDYPKDRFSALFNVIKETTDAEDGIPTLIIGLECAKKNIEGFSILNKKYEDQRVWWTYRKTERKYEYDNDIPEFYRFCLERMLSSVRYFYLDFTKYRYNETKRALKWLDSDTEKVCFLTSGSKFMFIYDTAINIVFGLSLTLCEYIGVDRRKVVSRIKRNKTNRFMKDTRFLDKEIRSVIDGNTHYIPVLSTFFRND